MGPTLTGTAAEHWVMEVLREQGTRHTGGVGRRRGRQGHPAVEGERVTRMDMGSSGV